MSTIDKTSSINFVLDHVPTLAYLQALSDVAGDDFDFSTLLYRTDNAALLGTDALGAIVTEDDLCSATAEMRQLYIKRAMRTLLQRLRHWRWQFLLFPM